ncbi:MAG: cytochrome P450 [Nitriliruptoraceae bacterium]
MTTGRGEPRASAAEPLAVAAFDPGSASFIADPYPAYARLRDEQPVAWYPAKQWWIVSRHADVDAILRDRRFGRRFDPRQPYERFAPWNLVNEHAMLELEPPDHTRLRRLVSHAFTPRRVEGMRQQIRSITDELVDGLIEYGSGDVLSLLAEPLPVSVIADLLGIEGSDRQLLRPWSNAIVALYEPAADPAVEDMAITAAREFVEYLDALINHRQRQPGDDLFSALVSLQVEGDRLNRNELIATAVLLLNAGHEASVNVVGNGLVALMDHRDEWTALTSSPDLAASMVEEAIRYDTPLSVFTRVASTDVDIAGDTIAAGETVGLLLASANRDDRAFPHPETFDIRRKPNPHLGFGAGIHFCLGAALARVELQEVFTQLATRLPELQLAGEPTRRNSYQFRGYARIPMVFNKRT